LPPDSLLEPVEFKRVGVVVNPAAGGGLQVFRPVVASVLSRFEDSALTGCCNCVEGLVDECIECRGAGRMHTLEAVKSLMAEGVELILVFGGDGTASDAAFALYQMNSSVPLMCVGVGSTNAGSLISFRGDEVSRFSLDSLEPVSVGGLVACVDDVAVGVGFNDVVLGTTVLATLDGRVVQVDAARFLRGERVVSQPEHVGDENSRVVVKRGDREMRVAGGFGQLFVGVVDERYRGKGVAGGVSLTSAFHLPAALALVDKPIVNYDLTVEDLFDLEPVTTRSVSLREGDAVCVRGVREGVCLNVDGTPLAVLERGNVITVRYQSELVRVLK
jgi:predicted polyphosphate/ATP-dependent NAD kinase